MSFSQPPAGPGYGPPPGWWLASDGQWYPPPAPLGATTSGPAAGYGPSWQPSMQQATNGLAVASMVLGILWLYWLGSILALIFGYVAKSQIRRSQGLQKGSGMATAGIVLGWIGLGTLALLFVIGFARAASSSY